MEKKITNKDLMEAISKIGDRVTELEKKPVPVEVTVTTPEKAQIKMSNGFPVPLEFQEIVDTTLNKKFQIEIDYIPEQAAFSFGVLVPREYSNASQSHWDTYHEDRRSKVIQNAYGANGVREYVSQIYDNFPPEIKSSITYDRAQIQ